MHLLDGEGRILAGEGLLALALIEKRALVGKTSADDAFLAAACGRELGPGRCWVSRLRIYDVLRRRNIRSIALMKRLRSKRSRREIAGSGKAFFLRFGLDAEYADRPAAIDHCTLGNHLFILGAVLQRYIRPEQAIDQFALLVLRLTCGQQGESKTNRHTPAHVAQAAEATASL